MAKSLNTVPRHPRSHVVAWTEDLRDLLGLEGRWKCFDRKDDARRHYIDMEQARWRALENVLGFDIHPALVRFAVAATGADADFLAWKRLSDPSSPVEWDIDPPDAWREPESIEVLDSDQPGPRCVNRWTTIELLSPAAAEAMALQHMKTLFAHPERNLDFLRALCTVRPIGATVAAMADGWSSLPFDSLQRPALPWELSVQEIARALICLRHHGRLAPEPLEDAPGDLDRALRTCFQDPVIVRHRIQHALKHEGPQALARLFDPGAGARTEHPSRMSYLRLAFRAALETFTAESIAALPEFFTIARDDGLPTLAFGCDPEEAEVRHSDVYWEYGGRPILRFDILARSAEDVVEQLRWFLHERPWLDDPSPAPPIAHRGQEASERADRRAWYFRSAVHPGGFLACALPTAREIDLRHRELARMLEQPEIGATPSSPALYGRGYQQLLKSTFTDADHDAWLARTYAYTASFRIEVRKAEPYGLPEHRVVMTNPLTSEERVFIIHRSAEEAEASARWLRDVSRTRSFKFLRRWTRHHEERGWPPDERTPIHYTADGLQV